MANQVTDWGAKQWVGMMFGLISVPSGYWIALANKQPGTGVDGTMLEQLEPPVTASSTSYARQELAATSSHWTLNDAGYVANLTEVNFGTPDTAWGYTPYYAICDAVTAGHVYAYGAFVNPQTVVPPFPVRIPIATLILQAISAVPSIVT